MIRYLTTVTLNLSEAGIICRARFEEYDAVFRSYLSSRNYVFRPYLSGIHASTKPLRRREEMLYELIACYSILLFDYRHFRLSVHVFQCKYTMEI